MIKQDVHHIFTYFLLQSMESEVGFSCPQAWDVSVLSRTFDVQEAQMKGSVVDRLVYNPVMPIKVARKEGISSSFVKVHNCCFCGKQFRRKDYLIQHVRIHTGEKPYVCPHCGRSFNQRSPMVNHLKICHGRSLNVK